MNQTTQLPDQLKNAQPSPWQERAKARIENSDWEDFCFEIILRVYDKIKTDKSLSQRWLAEQLGVSPQYVGKLLKGKENLTIQTIKKLESALNLKLIALADDQVEHNVALQPMKIPEFNELIVTVNNTSPAIEESIVAYEKFIQSA